MHLRVGYELIYDCPQPTPMMLMLMLMLNIHHSRANDIVRPDVLQTTPVVPKTTAPATSAMPARRLRTA